MKYQQKSFSHGYADSKPYAKNFEQAFGRKPDVKRRASKRTSPPAAREGAWVHDGTEHCFAGCCPCSECMHRNEWCFPPVSGHVVGHCMKFEPKPGWKKPGKGAKE